MSSHKKTSRLFSSPLLEWLTRTHSLVPVSMFLILAAALLIVSVRYNGIDAITASALFLSGLLCFTWVEYQVHRRIFHMKPSNTQRARLQQTIHGVHHDFPEDKSRLAMPPVLSITIALVILGLVRWIAGSLSFGFLAGFFAGYAGYLLVHYAVHAFRPPKNGLRILWKHHHIHHYKDDTCAFGVSSPLWDYIYNTMPAKK